MKSLRTRLLESREKLQIPWEVLERDYLLSWILAGISQIEILRTTLIFKGGTALKKCYFGDYRFSEDLDFTGLPLAPQDQTLDLAMREACNQAAKLLDTYAPIEISCQRYHERQPHPRGQEAFDIRARFPWHRQLQTTVMIEITRGEKFDIMLQVYTLEEIIAEKLRAILQNIQAFERKGWVRSRARDYYDLWRIFSAYKESLNLSNFQEILYQKCQHRGVSFSDSGSFFAPKLLVEVEKTWQQWLQPLLSNLPSYELVLKELRDQIRLFVLPQT